MRSCVRAQPCTRSLGCLQRRHRRPLRVRQILRHHAPPPGLAESVLAHESAWKNAVPCALTPIGIAFTIWNVFKNCGHRSSLDSLPGSTASLRDAPHLASVSTRSRLPAPRALEATARSRLGVLSLPSDLFRDVLHQVALDRAFVRSFKDDLVAFERAQSLLYIKGIGGGRELERRVYRAIPVPALESASMLALPETAVVI